MGKLSGVNANLITKVSGVPVANISKVGPILASSIGLGGGGGGGKIFSIDSWNESYSPCVSGQRSIDKTGSQTLYYNSGENRMYTDAGFTNPFIGIGTYYWNQTDNQWWGTINDQGYVEGYGNCG
jgi:hypothetical protein